MRLIDADSLKLSLIGLREEMIRRADISGAATISLIKILVESAPTVGWISVKERLPEENTKAIVITEDGYEIITLTEGEKNINV